MPIRIIRIINRLNLGGPTYNAALLTKHLAPQFETLLIAGSKLDSEESSEFIVRQLGVDFVKVPDMERAVSLTKDLPAYKKIKRLISDFKPDIVHTHASKAGALGRLAALSANVPVIVHTFHGHVFHSYFNPVKTKIFLNIERYLASRSDAIIAISEYQKEELVNEFKICKAEKVKVIPLGFDLSRFHNDKEKKRTAFRKQFDIADDEIVISIVGRLVPVKNHALFLKALKEVLNKTSQKIRAFVIGDGELRDSLLQLATELNIPNVYFPENKNKTLLTFVSWMQEVEYGIAGSDIIALSSDNEGTPVSLIEAQAAGKAIVATRAGGTENAVMEGKTALLSNAGDEAAFAANLLRLVEDHSLREFLSREGWAHVREKFHYVRLADDMRSLYMELLAKKSVKTTRFV